ncbi:MAG: hypothetical protein AVDCRST_MAG75-2774 [uncultured Propionibacteriaceae bacterium]|uniref:Uncharacterized protein n=1 Tax=uncultured Propionibacteriaceae bacterium TaxID=257457 RepID=A0A6J4PBW4_9ACTN|nr:MAG: hypothetical protein AVDCRST_MAG75-2774 [uncultured Propionibacteriaceae bacterium]
MGNQTRERVRIDQWRPSRPTWIAASRHPMERQGVFTRADRWLLGATTQWCWIRERESKSWSALAFDGDRSRCRAAVIDMARRDHY